MNNDSTLIDLLIFILYCLMYGIIGIPLLFLGLIFSILLLPVFVILKCIFALTNSQAICRFNNNLENTSLMDAPITDYEVDKETIVIIRTPLDTFKNTGGTMKVFRSSQANFSYATYIPWNESAMYIRNWAENSQWGSNIPKWTPWVKMGV